MWASEKGHTHCVQMLMERGAQVDVQDQVGVACD